MVRVRGGPRGKGKVETPTNEIEHQSPKRKKKEVDLPAAQTHGTTSDEEVVVRRSKGKGKAASSIPERDRKKVPTPSQLFAHLKHIPMPPTRFPDPAFLRETQLYEQVYRVLENMGLQSLLTMEPQPVYEEASRYFFSSLEAQFFGSTPDDRLGHGRIQFRVKGRVYKLGFKEIGEIMNFKDDIYNALPTEEWKLPTKVWHLITGNRPHNPQTDKSAHIRNPVIRYVHRILGNTLYARRESGNVLEDELKMLGLGIISVIGNAALIGEDANPYEELGMVGVFVKRLQYYQDWAWTTYDSTPQLCICGLVTPLLKAAGVPLGDDGQMPLFMDAPYMRRTKFLSGLLDDKYVYSFSLDTGLAELVLPAPNITIVRNKASLQFRVPQSYLLGPHGPLLTISDRRRGTKRRSSAATPPPGPSSSAAAAATSPHGHVSPSGSRTGLRSERGPHYSGPSRYYFEPHTGALPQGALRDAHDYIGKLEGWNRVQDKTIHKLKTKYKALKKTVKKNAETTARFMKKVSDLLVKGGVAGCSSQDFLLSDTSVPQPHRHSYHGTESTSMAQAPRLSEVHRDEDTTSSDDEDDYEEVNEDNEEDNEEDDENDDEDDDDAASDSF